MESVDERIKRIFPWHPETISAANPARLRNFVNGQWRGAENYTKVRSPLNGEYIIEMPNTQEGELKIFLESLAVCPLSGLHNPLFHPERYRMYGDICRNAAQFLRTTNGRAFFANLINLVMPKGWDECVGEVDCVASFLETFSGNQVRYLACGKTTPGDQKSQEARDYRWPYGPVAIITPFNFPLEILALQLLGALFMGNKPVLKQATTTSMVAEAFTRLLLDCGMPPDDMLLIHCSGSVMEKLVTAKNQDGNFIVQMTQFTGSSDAAKRLLKLTEGRVKIEDAGFDWKIIGPDVHTEDIDLVAKNCDRDAYAASGQKCSAQSILFVHKNWVQAGLLDRIEELAQKRNLKDLSVGPVLTWTNGDIEYHVAKLLNIPGARLLFGGRPFNYDEHQVPFCYGVYKPTAILIPLQEIMPNFKVVSTELFGPLQVIVEWRGQEDLDLILQICDRMENHLTAGIVSRDMKFIEYVAGRTVNGTTYAGIGARTTGAPEWQHFGPTGHPASAIIGTPEGIIRTWSQERGIRFNF